MTPAAISFVALVGLYTAIAAVFDVRRHRIPNFVTVPAAVLGLAYHTLMPEGIGPLASLAGFAIGFGLLLLPWLLGGGGMGDVKLLAALGAWLGPSLMLVAFAMSVVLAAVLALGMVAWFTCTRGVTDTKQAYFQSSAVRADDGTSRRSRRRRVLPFAVPVAVSTWCLLGWVLLQTQ